MRSYKALNSVSEQCHVQKTMKAELIGLAIAKLLQCKLLTTVLTCVSRHLDYE